MGVVLSVKWHGQTMTSESGLLLPDVVGTAVNSEQRAFLSGMSENNFGARLRPLRVTVGSGGFSQTSDLFTWALITRLHL